MRLPLLLLFGLGAAALVALVGRGGIVHYVGVVALVGFGLVVAGGVWLVGLVRRRRYGAAAAAAAAVGLLQLLSLPVGDALNRWDVARARAWCERTAPQMAGRSEAEVQAWLEQNGRGPMLADYHGSTCAQYERTSLDGWWEYAPATGRWHAMP